MKLIIILYLLLVSNDTIIKNNVALESTIKIENKKIYNNEICLLEINIIIDFLIKQEGWNTGQWDYKQYTTGYGTKANYPGQILSKEEAKKRLIKTYNKKLKEINKRYSNIDSVSKKRLLAAFIFNTGIKKSSKLNKLLIENRLEEAGLEMLKYHNVYKIIDGTKTKIPLEGLKNRRFLEYLMWISYD